jgi:hypothetical protein
MPSPRRKRWNDRMAERTRDTDVALYGASSGPCVEADTDAMKDRTTMSSTSSALTIPRAVRKATYRRRSRR